MGQTTFTQTNLVSDGSVPALQIDSNLINPWGVSHSPTSPFWISDNGTGLASIDSVSGQNVTLNGVPPVTVAPASPDAGPAAPTGQVFNAFQANDAFTLQDGKPATFLFATEDGTISGWNPGAGSQSLIAVNESQNPADGSEALGLGAVYKGLAIADTDQGPMLYAANFRHGTVDMFDQNFNAVGSFTDPNLPAGFAPFNVQVLDNKLFVTFAKQDDAKHDDVAGSGNGFVDEFNLSGQLLDRVASGGPLNSPWGMTIAPDSFGKFGGDLLVGNFGDGTIDAFDPNNFKFEGQLLGSDGKPIAIQDLWALTPGNGGSAGDPNTIYFTAGLQDEQHGLFGSLTPNSPTSSTVAANSGATSSMMGAANSGSTPSNSPIGSTMAANSGAAMSNSQISSTMGATQNSPTSSTMQMGAADFGSMMPNSQTSSTMGAANSGSMAPNSPIGSAMPASSGAVMSNSQTSSMMVAANQMNPPSGY